MRRIFNVYHPETPNVGDRYCAPSLFFDLGVPVERRHIWTRGGMAGHVVILGGGGMLYPNFAGRLREIAGACTVIPWGIGTNTHGSDAIPVYPRWFARCPLVGVRDDVSGLRWVPCASCMSPAFDNPPPPVHPVVVYEHWEGHYLPKVDGAPRMRNDVRTIEGAVAFLASGEVVVTNTYHGAYWATLLGRRVVQYPFSTKFAAARYAHETGIPGTPVERLIADSHAYPGALAECREANKAFYWDVRSFLER